METFTLRRKGDFTVKTYGENPCGTFPDQKVKYDLKCVCFADLDNRDFLMDVSDVKKFFDDITKTDMSCERLAKSAVEAFVEMAIHETDMSLKSVKLALSAEPYASTFTYAIGGADLQDLIKGLDSGNYYVPPFLRDEHAEPRGAAHDDSEEEYAKDGGGPVEEDVPESYALYNTKKNRWVGEKVNGPAVTFDYEDDAWTYHEDREFSDAIEVRPFTQVEGVYGVWNLDTNSWMRASYHGGDRKFSSVAEAEAKIQEKRHGSNGRNWQNVEVRPFSPATGNPPVAVTGTTEVNQFGIWNKATGSWMHSRYHGGDRVYSSAEKAQAKIAEKMGGYGRGGNWATCEVRPYGTQGNVAAVAAAFPVGSLKTVDRWGIWNSETNSWMHTNSHTGKDRVYSTKAEAQNKIQEKAKGPTGRNWIHCSAQPYTGNPEALPARLPKPAPGC